MTTYLDREKLLSIGYLPRGRSRSQHVKEYRQDGHAVKETIDAAGNSTIEHDTPDNRVDVMIRPGLVESKPEKVGI